MEKLSPSPPDLRQVLDRPRPRGETYCPFISVTARCASSRWRYTTKAKQGGVRANHSSCTLPNLSKAFISAVLDGSSPMLPTCTRVEAGEPLRLRLRLRLLLLLLLLLLRRRRRLLLLWLLALLLLLLLLRLRLLLRLGIMA